MSTFDPFGEDALADLVKVNEESEPIRVFTRESAQKEFKESFTWGSIGSYARTMAAFANARGGYLIFGVTDNPRIAIGLSESGLDAFDNLERAKLTNGLNELFSPEIHWDSTLLGLSSVTLGLIYVFESDNKPVITRKSSQAQNANLVEGDILYRYNSRTERAKFPELKRIIDDAKSREQRAMMRHIEEIIKAGASNAAVLDFNSSTLQGPNGDRLLVSHELLDKISFIREGEFSEVVGAPTLRLVGDVESTNTITFGPERVVRQTITTEDVITGFLNQSHGTEPREYIRQAATGTTSFVPVHFYREAAGMSNSQLIDFVSGIITRSPAKRKLLERLRASDALQIAPPSSSQQHPSTVARKQHYDSLISGNVPELPFPDANSANHFLSAMRSLSDDVIVNTHESLLDILKHCMEHHYASPSNVADNFRRAVCRIDVALFGPA